MNELGLSPALSLWLSLSLSLYIYLSISLYLSLSRRVSEITNLLVKSFVLSYLQLKLCLTTLISDLWSRRQPAGSCTSTSCWDWNQETKGAGIIEHTISLFLMYFCCCLCICLLFIGNSWKICLITVTSQEIAIFLKHTILWLSKFKNCLHQPK